ncbi:3-deoxy-D-manno-octulosonic acid transferase [Simkania sp.]|uniref:3-deoxy-D-manno-octulosonic acid transferase n=1 Tax=Simkania sp. TaxID=34094 RepID=UPI003B51F179
MKFLLSLIYNCALFVLMLVFFPRLLWQRVVHGKYRKSFLSRIQGKGPRPESKGPVIWLHAVSVGEVKALSTLTSHIRKASPDAFILVSTVTETGQSEAKRLIKEANAFCYLPLDFPWIVRRFVQRLQPDLLVLIEGDFWLNLLKEVKKSEGSVVLVNGKISERSLKRYLFMKSFGQELFQRIDAFCVQSEEYLKRFLKLGIAPEKLTVIGNLKYDIPAPEPTDAEIAKWKEKLGVQPSDLVLTVGSTHEREEELLLRALKPLWNKYENLKLLLVPRHPERFRKVEKMIEDEGAQFTCYSNLAERKGDEKIILIDEMGVLPKCYRISDLSIVGGSFVEGIGGHDIFEPAKMGIPVLFGPHMHKQVELTQNLTQSGVGKQIPIDELADVLEKYLSNPPSMKEDGEKGKRFAQKVMGCAFRTWKEIERYATSS